MGHGGLLAGRYRLEERVRAGAEGSLWRAIDETLDRSVSVRIVRPGHRYTADVIDAARRAALVEDARLVRVLDVGESAGSGYIVSEHLVGRTLDELLGTGPLPAETVRRLVGEAAEALDRASTRGLHHLLLTPSSLVVAPDGNVKVLGTAVEAALAGVEQDEDPIGADRLDAVCLVRILYAGLTGRWTGSIDGPLGPAPRVTGRIVPPGDLVAGIPNDLDTLCTVTLGPHDDGPHSPGELAMQLAPWGIAEPLTTPSGLPIGRSAPGASEGADPSRPSTTVDGIGQPGAKIVRHATPARGVTVPAEPELPTLLPAGLDAPMPAESTVIDLTAPSARTTPGAAVSPGRVPASTTTAGVGRAPAAGLSLSDGLSDGLPDRDDDWALLTPPDRSASDRPRARPEPLGPFIPPAPVSRPPRDQARLVLMVVAGLVVLGLILAVFSLRGLFGSATPLVQPPTPGAGASSTTPSGSAEAAPPRSTGDSIGSVRTVPTGPAAEISGIQAIDPEGDGDENGSTADRAIDADPTTNWRSARYESRSFGGLKKGLGLYLQTSAGAVAEVTVEMSGQGGQVQLLTARGPGLEGTTLVAEAQSSNGRAVLRPAQPIPSGPLLLWFTELPQQDNGDYRLIVSEIAAG